MKSQIAKISISILLRTSASSADFPHGCAYTQLSSLAEKEAYLRVLLSLAEKEAYLSVLLSLEESVSRLWKKEEKMWTLS